MILKFSHILGLHFEWRRVNSLLLLLLAKYQNMED